MSIEIALLALGRLDGRLTHSPAAQPWLIKARLEGAAQAACNAGVPIDASDLEAWISGARNPPRSSEGLNDPLSVAAIVCFYFLSLDRSRAVHDTAVTRLLGAILDHESEANLWATADLVQFGPLWRALAKVAKSPGLEPTVRSVADRLLEMARVAVKAEGHRQIAATTPDGRQLIFAQDERRAWLISIMVPSLLRRSGLTSNLIPSIVPPIRFLNAGSRELAEVLQDCIARSAASGIKSIAMLERKIAEIETNYSRSTRSRLRAVAELGLALPSLSRKKLAVAVNATPAGAGYLVRQLGR